MIASPILFVIDDINYNGGAHMATARLVAHLTVAGHRVTVFSSTDVQSEEIGLRFNGADIRSAGSPITRFDQMGIMEALNCKSFSLLRKAQRVIIGVLKRLGLYYPMVYDNEKRLLGRLLSECSEVVVVGENSIFADFVAHNCFVRKVIMIHTDYDALARFEGYTIFRRYHDLRVCEKMDAIGIIGEGNCNRFKKRHKKLASKCFPFLNYVQEFPRRIHVSNSIKQCQTFHALTICRFDANKDVLRLLRIAERLKRSGLRFRWDIYGDGPLFVDATAAVSRMGLEDCVRLPGYVHNTAISFCDYNVMVMASHYEGCCPLVVFEALSSCLPVLATDVGSMSNWIDGDKIGWIVKDSTKAIYKKLHELISDPHLIIPVAGNLVGWQCNFDDAKVAELYQKLFDL